MTRISDSELIIEEPSARETAKGILRRRRRARASMFSVSPATVRESSGPWYLPVGAFAFWWKQEVMRPVPGEIQRKLYGK